MMARERTGHLGERTGHLGERTGHLGERTGHLCRVKNHHRIGLPLTQTEESQIQTIIGHLMNNQDHKAKEEISELENKVKCKLFQNGVGRGDIKLMAKLFEMTSKDETHGRTNTASSTYMFSSIMFATVNNDPIALESLLEWITSEDLGNLKTKFCNGKFNNPLLTACLEGFTRCVLILDKHGFKLDLKEECKKKLEKMVDMNKAVFHEFHLYAAMYFGCKNPDWRQFEKKYTTTDKKDPVEQYLQFKAFSSPVYIAARFINAEENQSKLRNFDPILNAFANSTYSKYLAEYHDHKRAEYMKVGETCEEFVEDLLDQCDNMEQVQILLDHTHHEDSSNDDDPCIRNWGIALWGGQKKTVGHPYYQQFIWDKMVGDNFDWGTYFFFWKILFIPYGIILFFLFPIVVILDLFRDANILFIPPACKDNHDVEGESEQIEMKETRSEDPEQFSRSSTDPDHWFFSFFRERIHRPFFRVFVHIFIEIFFLVVLMFSLLDPLDRKYFYDIHWYDIVTFVLVAHFLMEGIFEIYRTGWRFLSSFWNTYFLLNHMLFVLGDILKFHAYQTEGDTDNRNLLSGNHPANIGSTLFAVASAMSVIGVMRWLLLIRQVGPVLLCIISVIRDIFTVFLIFVLVFVGFSVSMYAMYKPFKGDTEHYPSQDLLPASETFSALFWVFFDPGNPEKATVKRNISSNNLTNINTETSLEFSHFVGLALWAVYQGIVVIISFNILIALMNHRYDRLFQNADLEWKYSKSFMYITFLTPRAVFPPPFRWFYYLAWIVRRYKKSAIIPDNTRETKKYCELLQKLLKQKFRPHLEKLTGGKYDDPCKLIKELTEEEVMLHKILALLENK